MIPEPLDTYQLTLLELREAFHSYKHMDDKSCSNMASIITYLSLVLGLSEDTLYTALNNPLLATDIQWDITESEDELPTEIEIPIDNYDIDSISDYLSEQTGYCHNGFSLTIR